MYLNLKFMASISVKVSAEELDEFFLKNLRALFKNGQLNITFESDNTVALEQLSGILTGRQQAAQDPLFLADVAEVMDDFAYADQDVL